MVRHALMALAAAAVAMCTPVAAATACPVQSFGVNKAGACTDKKCGSFTPPKDIERITRGIYSEYVGLFINDGIASWLGLDLARREIVEVQRFAGRHLSAAPEVKVPSTTHYRRETKTDSVQLIDVVRKASVVPSKLPEIICLANQLWKAAYDAQLPGHATDVHNALFLVDRNTTKSFGGPGDLAGDAQALRAQLQSLKNPAW